MTGPTADLLIRIRGRDTGSGSYPVEAQLMDGSHYEGAALVLDRAALLAAESDPDAGRYGRLLFDALFTGPIKDALGAAAASHDAGGGLRIRLEIDRAASELESIRWERLYRERHGTWLPASTAGDSPFSRYIALPIPEPRPIATRPIRILLAVSNPTGLPGKLQAIEVVEEIETVRRALRDAAATDDVDVTVLPGRTGLPPEVRGSLEADGFTIVDGPTSLRQLVRRLSDSHIVHFVGHGAFRSGDGGAPPESALFLEAEDGTWDAVTATQLVERFAAVEPAPALVYFSACESGRAADDLGQPFLGLAPKLVAAGAAAVVAMQAPVPVDTARTLTLDFYRVLLEDGTVDAALNSARAVVFDAGRLDWTIPVLFTRLREGRLLVARDLARVVIADDVALAPEPEHGVVANRVDVVPAARPRPFPVLKLPRDFPDLVGREAEVRQVLADLGAGAMVEIHGQPGIGKTVLLRHVANRAGTIAQEGVVHVARGGEPVHDLLQYLFDALYEAPASLRPTDVELERRLADRAPVVVVDDAELSRDALQLLIELVPGATFLFAATERNLWGEGRAIGLGGLPPDAGLALFERSLGRHLTVDERPRATELCTALAGQPLHLLQAADRVVHGSWPAPLEVVADGSGPAGRPSLARPVEELGHAERRVLGIIAAAGGPIRLDRIEAVAGLPDAEEPCLQLRRAGRIRTASPRYELAEPLTPGERAALDVPGWRALLLAHLVAWVEQNRNSPATLMRDLDTVLGVLDGSDAADDPGQLGRLARGAEGALILAKRWDRWREVLDREADLATATGDRAAWGWVRHQQGSRALALQDERSARSSLQEALRIREDLGDADGALRTRHNLELLGPLPPPPGGDSSPPRPGPAPRRSWMRPAMLGLAAITLVGAGLLVVRATGRPPIASPAPTESPGTFAAKPAFGADQLNLGEVEIGSSARQPVPLLNDGDGPLAIEAIVLVPEVDGLGVDSDCGSSLPAGGSCRIVVTFAPSVEGDRRTELVLTGDMPEGRAAVPVVARGVAPPGVGALTITPSAMEFGPVPLGTADRREITLESSGSADVTILEIVRPISRVFTIDGDVERPCAAGRTLAPGDTCRIGVTFLPRAADPAEAAIVIRDDGAGGTHRVVLTGAGPLGLADLQVSIDNLGGATLRDDGLTTVPIIVIVRNEGDVEATSGSIVAFAGDTGWSDPAAGFLVALQADPTDGVDQATGFAPAISVSIPPGGSFSFNGSLLFGEFFAGKAVDVVVDVDSCAGREIFDAEILRRCEVPEVDEGNNRSNTLTLDLGVTP